MENTGHYQETIFNLLIEKGQSVLQINAASTHEERKSLLDYSKTDDIDLHAIASAISGGKVTFNEVPTGLKAELRYLTRTRRFLVRERSKLIVMVRNLLDHYWPYLQGIPEIVDGKTQVKRIFEELNTPLFLRFIQSVSSPKEALAFGETGLMQLSKQLSFHFGLERIRLILRSAELSPPVDNIMLEHYVYHVKYHINGIICLNQEINNLEHQIEQLFCQTRGVLLLSMHQVNVTTAAEFMAEVGLDIDRYHSASAIIKLAGTNPVPYQSAGINGQMRISKQGNPWLREAVGRIGKNLTHGKNPYFVAFTKHLSCRYGKQKRVAAGNKFIRIAYAMLTKGELFAPKVWQGESLTVDPLGKLSAKNVETARQVLISILGDKAR